MGDCSVQVRFHEPPLALRRYFTTFYITEIDVVGGGRVADHLHPEWANVRFFSGDRPDSWIGDQALSGAGAVAIGPTGTATRFMIGSGRLWGVGLLPLGWAKFVQARAADRANVLSDVAEDPAYASFRPLAATIFSDEPDELAELARITAHFEALSDLHVADEARIVACHEAVIDPEVASVARLSEVTGLPAHTVERVCRRYFGFPPRLLLSRQRFLRSLVQYMLDPSLKWIGALDGHYHDQAQFVRDFRRFMGMSPREYAALPRPVLSAVMRARHEAAGAAVQVLHRPAA